MFLRHSFLCKLENKLFCYKSHRKQHIKLLQTKFIVSCNTEHGFIVLKFESHNKLPMVLEFILLGVLLRKGSFFLLFLM